MNLTQEDAFIAGQQELLEQLRASLLGILKQQRDPNIPLEHGEAGPQYYRGRKSGLESAMSLLSLAEAKVEVRNRKLQFLQKQEQP